MTDLLVVGGGIMGLSVARAGVEAGLQVVVLEQDTIPNPRSSSNDLHRLIRLPYGAMSGYRRMVAEAYPAWERLWRTLRSEHVVQTGTLLVGSPDRGWSGASFRDLGSVGVPLDSASPSDLARRVPGFQARPGSRAVFLQSGGVLLADRILADLAAWLRGHGAELRERARVRRHGDRWIELDGGEQLAGRHVVLATGPWTVGGEPGDFAPSRQTVLYVHPPADSPWERAPMILDLTEPDGFYLVPPVAGTPAKLGDHAFSRRGAPDDDREATARETQALQGLLASRLPDLARGTVAGVRACYYGVVGDEQFRCVRSNGAWRLAGFSGHGFKFGPLVGERFVMMLLGRLTEQAFVDWLAGR